MATADTAGCETAKTPTTVIPYNSQASSYNPAYRATAWGNQANMNRSLAQQNYQFWSGQKSAQSQYRLANQGLNDRFLNFGVNALAGLMR